MTWQAFDPTAPTYLEEDEDLFYVSDGTSRYATMRFGPSDATVAVILSHGNAEDLGVVRHSFKKDAADLGVAVFAYDYPGYGRTAGTASEGGCFSAVDAVYRHVTEEASFPPDRIALWGYSIGSGPALYLAARLWGAARTKMDAAPPPIGPIVLESPLYSCVSTVFPKAAVLARLSYSDIMVNYRRIPKVKSPILFLHGRLDGIAPVEQVEALSKLAPNLHGLVIYDTAGHNGMRTTHRDDLFAKVRGLLRLCEDDRVPKAVVDVDIAVTPPPALAESAAVAAAPLASKDADEAPSGSKKKGD